MTKEQEFNDALQWYLDRGHKVENMREDIRFRPLALRLGYTITYEGFANCLTFTRGNKTVWYCCKGWACAERQPDHTYKYHRYRDSLEKTLLEEASDEANSDSDTMACGQ